MAKALCFVLVYTNMGPDQAKMILQIGYMTFGGM